MERWSRRKLIRSFCGCAGGLAMAHYFPGLQIERAFASTGNGTKLVFINLNGGLDGLTALQPRSGAPYDAVRTIRPDLSLPAEQLLPVTSAFGFHPNLTAMKSLYDEGKLMAVLNVGYRNMSRSHLDSEVAFARGVGDRLSPAASGFVNRLGAAYGWGSLQAVSVAGSDRSFEGGEYSGIQTRGLENFYFKQDDTTDRHESDYRREFLYSTAADSVLNPAKPLQEAVTAGLNVAVNTTDIVRQAVTDASFPNAYPSTIEGRMFKDIDILLSNPETSTELAYMRRIGFDTHSKQDVLLPQLLSSFNAALAVFIANMKAKGLFQNLIIVVFSEFGRTNRQNGSNGADHGGANALYLMGGPVSGGLVGDISSSDLTSYGWLQMKINVIEIYRQLIARMGYDPNLIFETPAQTVLPTLFA